MKIFFFNRISGSNRNKISLKKAFATTEVLPEEIFSEMFQRDAIQR